MKAVFLVVTKPPSEPEPLTFARATRQAALRGACFGALLALPSGLLGCWLERWSPECFLTSMLAGFLCGLLTAPAAIVELLAQSRPASVRREVAVGLLTALVAAAGLGAAIAQTVFTVTLFSEGSVEPAMNAVHRVLREVESPLGALLGLVALTPLTLPFVSVASSRLRRRSFTGGALFALACGAFAALPTLATLAALHLAGVEAFLACLAFVALDLVAASLLMGAATLAEHADSWIEGDAS